MTNIFDTIKPTLLSALLISSFCLTACNGGGSSNSEINNHVSGAKQGGHSTTTVDLGTSVADDVITGHVYLDTTLTEEKEYWAQVTLQDISLADGTSTLVSEVSLTELSGDSFQFSLAYSAAEIDERSFYSVGIKVYIKTSTETDKLVFNNTHSLGVITQGMPTDINAELQRVKTSSNRGAIQFVDNIDEVERETIENFKSVSFTNDGDAAYGRNRMDVEFDILGGCEDLNFTLYIENTFLESNPVQVRAKLVNDIIDDCTYQQSASVSINLIPLQQRYEEAYSDRTGSIIIGDFGLYEMEVSTFRNDISYSLLSCPTDVTPTANLESILFSALGDATLHFANQLDEPLWANYDLAGQDISVNYSLPGIFFTQEFNFSVPQDPDIIVDSNGCTFAVTSSCSSSGDVELPDHSDTAVDEGSTLEYGDKSGDKYGDSGAITFEFNTDRRCGHDTANINRLFVEHGSVALASLRKIRNLGENAIVEFLLPEESIVFTGRVKFNKTSPSGLQSIRIDSDNGTSLSYMHIHFFTSNLVEGNIYWHNGNYVIQGNDKVTYIIEKTKLWRLVGSPSEG